MELEASLRVVAKRRNAPVPLAPMGPNKTCALRSNGKRAMIGVAGATASYLRACFSIIAITSSTVAGLARQGCSQMMPSFSST